MRVSASFQIIPRPVGRLRLGLGSKPHVIGRLESGPRVGAGGGLPPVGIFGRGGCLQGWSCLQGWLSPRTDSRTVAKKGNYDPGGSVWEGGIGRSLNAPLHSRSKRQIRRVSLDGVELQSVLTTFIVQSHRLQLRLQTARCGLIR